MKQLNNTINRAGVIERHIKYQKKLVFKKQYSINSKRTVSFEELEVREACKKIFRNEEIIYNNRRLMNGLELDIYIPSLRLGIEYNGKGHYSKNDEIKKKLCFMRGVRLLTLTTSDNDKYLRRTINKFLITNNIHPLKNNGLGAI